MPIFARDDIAPAARAYFDIFSKKLPKEILAKIENTPAAANALYLRAVLDELRQFGIHEELEAKASGYLSAPDLQTLFDRIITRWHLNQLKIEKINIIGGEPLLYPFTYDIIKIAKNIGFVTSITTNGSLLTKSKIKMFSPYLDWIGLSVDSKYEPIEREMGRRCGKHVQNALKICGIIKEEGIKLKVSTTVTKLNCKEKMKQFIRKLDPNIWENLQVSFKKGHNEDIIRNLSINETEFENYMRLWHSRVYSLFFDL